MTSRPPPGTLPPVSVDWVNLLQNFASRATLVKDRPYRQVWRFEEAGRPYYLKFYPRRGGRLKRIIRGSPAWREFDRLRRLHKAGVPAPRAEVHLVGFTLGNAKGDAVVLRGIEPSVPLDRYVNDLLLRGEPIPNHRDLVEQILQIMDKLLDAQLGHADLHLGNFLLHDGKLSLLDGYAVRRRGMRPRDILLLGHSVQRVATTTDLLRGWRGLGFGLTLPRRNPITPGRWRKLLSRIFGENRSFGRLNDGDWSGVYFKRTDYARRWAPVSGFTTSHDDWRQAWAHLREQIESDQLEILKRSPSGDVLAGEIVLEGRPVQVVVKHPRRKFWHRWITEIGRGSRPRRAWRRAWELIVRDLPTAWPLLLMERRVMGYVVDSLIVFERVQGEMLATLDLDALEPSPRDMLFRRLARALRRLEQTGLSQFDAKMSNWMIITDEKLGPVPVVIDLDGIRPDPGWPRALERLLRSMKDHPQYTPADSLALCKGYAPYAEVKAEAPPPEARSDHDIGGAA